MLLSCAVLLTVTAGTIHEDRRAAFRSAAEMLPQELEDRIWGYYLDIVYGDSPQSPILSLEETQALFPLLELGSDPWSRWHVKYKAEPSDLILPDDRYLTLHVTDASETQDQDWLSLFVEVTNDTCRFAGLFTSKTNRYS